MTQIEGKTAVVVAGGNGVGRSIVLALRQSSAQRGGRFSAKARGPSW